MGCKATTVALVPQGPLIPALLLFMRLVCLRALPLSYLLLRKPSSYKHMRPDLCWVQVSSLLHLPCTLRTTMAATSLAHPLPAGALSWTHFKLASICQGRLGQPFSKPGSALCIYKASQNKTRIDKRAAYAQIVHAESWLSFSLLTHFAVHRLKVSAHSLPLAQTGHGRSYCMAQE
jgi:hypothetical protein